MKNFNNSAILCLIIVVACIFYSCKKSNNNPNPTTFSMVGYWYGSFNNGASKQSFLFKSNGTLRVYDFYGASSLTDTTKALIGNGTYSVSGNTLTVSTYFPNGQSFPNSVVIIDETAIPPSFAAANNTIDVYVKQ